jgi:SAM-dependent methyltransferase
VSTLDAENPLERFALASAARESLAAWTNGAQVVTLITTLRDRGWTKFLAEPRELETLAEFAGLPPTRLADILAVLEANGIARRQDGTVQLTRQFEALAAADSYIGLDELLDHSDVMSRLIRTAADDPGPLPLTEPDALVIARALGGKATEVTRTLYEQSFLPKLPEVIEAIHAGPWLDVGCGVAGATLTLATLLPEFRAVAIELVPTVAAETLRRVKEHGVADRVDVRCMDARDFDEPAAFGGAFWAQPFFPEPTRAATLAVILRSLMPGGTLIVQEMEPPEPDESGRPAYTLRKLVAHGWEVPFGRSAEDLAAEGQAAGFELVRLAPTDFGRMIILRRPLR